MQIDIIRLLLDFGLVVLIWIIQRIVYPSFLHYSTGNLVTCHRIYTSRFSAIVIPLMFGQLGVSIYQLFTQTSFYTVSSLVIIILIWISTFWIFVPIHSIISNENSSKSDLVTLVNKNWVRTILWTLSFIYSLFEVLDF